MKSIYDMTLIRIIEKDMYLAYYTLDRLESIPPEYQNLVNLRTFLDGAVNMLKKKYKEGINSLACVDTVKLNEALVLKLIPSYRAYGMFCLGQIASASQIYEELERKGWITESDNFNQLLCKGILLGEEKKFEEARSMFEKARKMYKIRVEPTFYLVVSCHGNSKRYLTLFSSYPPTLLL